MVFFFKVPSFSCEEHRHPKYDSVHNSPLLIHNNQSIRISVQTHAQIPITNHGFRKFSRVQSPNFIVDICSVGLIANLNHLSPKFSKLPGHLVGGSIGGVQDQTYSIQCVFQRKGVLHRRRNVPEHRQFGDCDQSVLSLGGVDSCLSSTNLYLLSISSEI